MERIPVASVPGTTSPGRESELTSFRCFTRQNTGPKRRESIDVRSVRRMLLQITKLRGLPPMHPLLLRHACATHLLYNGCPLDVTAYYAQVSTR
jgi:integrase